MCEFRITLQSHTVHYLSNIFTDQTSWTWSSTTRSISSAAYISSFLCAIDDLIGIARRFGTVDNRSSSMIMRDVQQCMNYLRSAISAEIFDQLIPDVHNIIANPNIPLVSNIVREKLQDSIHF